MRINPYRMQQQQMAMQQALARQMGPVNRAMVVSDSPTPFDGCCNFFDRCTDELMSLHFSGALPFLDWIGWSVTDVCLKSFEYIVYLRPEQSGGNPTVGYLDDPCEEPLSYDFGTCKLTIEDFGHYGRKGKIRNMMKPSKYCATDPVRRLDGSVVSNEKEWDSRFVTDLMMQDLNRDIIVGNATSNAGQINGLETVVSTGYTCEPLDSIVINWNGNTMAGGAGVTWNGAAVSATADFVNVLRAVIRRIKQRVSWSPALRNQQMNLGDMILLMPSHMAECLLDFYTCWSVCEGTQYNEVMLQTYEARSFRDSLMGGLFGFGQITIEGVPIPIMGHDFGLIKTPNTGDIYLLTRSLGGVRALEGEHLSADQAISLYGSNATSGLFSTDGGRILGRYWDDGNQCIVLKQWMHPRFFSRAPWLQVRFQNVRCTPIGGILSPDPNESSFQMLSSFGSYQANCE